MKELKKQVLNTLADVNDVWVEAIKEAEKTKQGMDVTEITGRVIRLMADLDEKFSDCEDRVSGANKTKKGGLFQ